MVGARLILLERSRYLSYVLFSFLLCNRRNRLACFPINHHQQQHPQVQLLRLQPNKAIEESSSVPTRQGLLESATTAEGAYDDWQKNNKCTAQAQPPAQNDLDQSILRDYQHHHHHHHRVLQDTLTFRCETLGDHRASLATFVGYTTTTSTAHGGVDSSTTNIVVAVQPDRNAGRKLLFFQCHENDDDDDDDATITDTTTKFLGHVLVEKEETAKISRLRGIQVLDRGKSYTSLFVSIWCQLCLEAGLQPTTVSINKPLLAWSLVRLGFHPTITANRHPKQEHPSTTNQASSTANQSFQPPRRLKKSQIRLLPLWVNIAPPAITSSSSSSVVSISCRYSQDLEHLQDGFTDTELKSQRLVLTTKQATVGGKVVQIRTPYEWSSSIPDVSSTALSSSSSSDGGGGGGSSSIVSSGDSDADPTTVASTTTSSLFRGGHCRLHFGASLLRIVVTGTGEQDRYREREEEESSISSSSEPPRRSHREAAALHVLTGPLPAFRKTP